MTFKLTSVSTMQLGDITVLSSLTIEGQENNSLAACPHFIIICHVDIKYQFFFFSLKGSRFNHLVILWLEERTKMAIDHFTVVGLVTRPLNGSEAGVDLVLIQTSLLLLCKSSCSYANYLPFTWGKQRGLYQSKVTSSLACIHGQATKHATVNWFIGKLSFH